MDIDPQIAKNPDDDPRPIPEVLHSVYEEGPFTVCTVCNEDLADGRLYEIQKTFRGSQTIFELAVCHRCGESVSKEFSAESVERVTSYLLEHFKPSEEIERCHFCDSPKSQFRNLTMVGLCRQRFLVVPTIVMCEPCNESLQELLSKKTRDIQDDFVRDNFPGVPADLDLSPSFGLLG